MKAGIFALRSRFDGFATSKNYRNYVLGIIVVVSVFNFLDRQILSILLEPIRAEFGLTDTQIGVMSGFAFSLFYSLFSIPLARFADRHSRTFLIVWVVAVWSLMTALCGLTVGFYTLLLARICVGINEAGSSPASQSLIADYFAPEERATAMGIYSSGIYFGIMLGFLLGGWINELLGWRMAFVVVGLPGLLVALIFWLTVREPARGQSEMVLDEGEMPTLAEVFQVIWRKKSFRFMPFAMGFSAFVVYCNLIWAPSFFIRTHGMSTAEVGTWLAFTSGLFGMGGSYFGGFIADRVVARTKDARWYMWIPAAATLLSLPFLVAVYLSPSPIQAMLIFSIVWFLGNMWIGPTFATVQGISPLRMRATSLAILILVNNIIGLGLGPLIVGVLSDAFSPTLGVESLRYALLSATIPAGVLSGIGFILVARSVRQDLPQQGSVN
jgi:MFS family permease